MIREDFLRKNKELLAVLKGRFPSEVSRNIQRHIQDLQELPPEYLELILQDPEFKGRIHYIVALWRVFAIN